MEILRLSLYVIFAGLFILAWKKYKDASYKVFFYLGMVGLLLAVWSDWVVPAIDLSLSGKIINLQVVTTVRSALVVGWAYVIYN